MARDGTVTTLGVCLTASYQWCMVIPGTSRGIPDSLHQRLWPFIPTPRIFWELPEKVVLAGAAYRVFGSTLQGLKQSIVGLSPLSKSTYSTSHEIPNDGS
jgi:hypothetical protein